VGIGGFVVQRECPLSRPLEAGISLCFRPAGKVEQLGDKLNLRQPGVRIRVARIALDRLAIILDRLQVSFVEARSPEELSPAVELVGHRIPGGLLRQHPPPVLPQLDLEGLHDLPRDLLLHPQDIL
jgi:hypothetical protein